MGRRSPHARAVTEYVRAVQTGERSAGRLERLGVDRYLRDLERVADGSAGYKFDARAAERACDFFGLLRHSKGQWAGKPFALAPWQTFLVWQMAGWIRHDGTRRIRQVYIEVARKNGKSCWVAGLGLYFGFFDGEAGAETYCAATKREQARIVHGEAVRMVQRSPGLGITKHRDNLHVIDTSSKFEPLGADADTTDGLNIHCAIIDEFHAHRDRDLFDRLETATGARQQPILITITTAGDDEQSPCFAEHERSRAVLEQTLEDESLLSFIAAPDQGDDWTDPRTWEKGNPNLGVSVRLEELAEQCKIAQQSPQRENAFRRFRMNQWTRATTRFLSFDAWQRCGITETTEQLEEYLEGDLCYAGLDLSSKSDMTSLALVFAPENRDTGIYRVLWRMFMPEGALDRPSRPKSVPFEAWAQSGHLILTPGEALDHAAVFSEIASLVPRFRIHEVMLDRWGSGFVRPQIEELGLVVAEFGQGFQSMSEPTKALEALVLSERLDHGNHPVAAWHAECLEVRSDPAGNLKPEKPDTRKSAKRIDGMVALIMGLARAMLLGASPPSGRSVYDERGLFSL